MDQPIIELIELTKDYDTVTAVDHLNLTVRKGEIFGLLGPNGAGKSTTILMMLGLTEPTSGTAKVCGINATIEPAEVKKRVGYLPDNVGFYEGMTGLENLMYIGRLNGLSPKTARQKGMELLARVGLKDAIGKKTGKYSRGMIQRLGLADVLIKSPEIIILDEPTLGIDPRGIREFLTLIVRMSREEGLTVLLSSHHLHQVQEVCDRVGIFVSGKLIAEGDIDTLSATLFSEEPYIIDAGIRLNDFSKDNESMLSELKHKMQQLEGIKSVNYQNEHLKISCTRDASTDIARMIVESDIGLHSLSRKEHGLDDVYHRYFEQGLE